MFWPNKHYIRHACWPCWLYVAYPHDYQGHVFISLCSTIEHFCTVTYCCLSPYYRCRGRGWWTERSGVRCLAVSWRSAVWHHLLAYRLRCHDNAQQTSILAPHTAPRQPLLINNVPRRAHYCCNMHTVDCRAAPLGSLGFSLPPPHHHPMLMMDWPSPVLTHRVAGIISKPGPRG